VTIDNVQRRNCCPTPAASNDGQQEALVVVVAYLNPRRTQTPFSSSIVAVHKQEKLKAAFDGITLKHLRFGAFTFPKSLFSFTIHLHKFQERTSQTTFANRFFTAFLFRGERVFARAFASDYFP
jgi:hypothetical protein